MTLDDRMALETDLQQAEGYRPKAYQDTEGVWTIGYGTNLQELEIDEPLALQWLREKMAQAEFDAGRYPWFAGLTPRRQRAIVELVYNLGIPRFSGFVKMRAELASGDYEQAAIELMNSKWARQVGPSRSQRLFQMIRLG